MFGVVAPDASCPALWRRTPPVRRCGAGHLRGHNSDADAAGRTKMMDCKNDTDYFKPLGRYLWHKQIIEELPTAPGWPAHKMEPSGQMSFHRQLCRYVGT